MAKTNKTFKCHGCGHEFPEDQKQIIASQPNHRNRKGLQAHSFCTACGERRCPSVAVEATEQLDPLDELTMYMCTMGLSVSQAIRRYSNIHGLPKGF